MDDAGAGVTRSKKGDKELAARFEKLTPMLNVPDVSSTVAWYVSIGFEVLHTFEDSGVPNWALLARDSAEVMINRRDLPKEAALGGNLYVHVDDVDSLWADLKDRVTVTEALTDQFYGMRDFWVEDPNGYILGFGQKIEAGTG